MAARAYIGERGPCRPWSGRQAPFFCQEPRCEFEEKKLHLGPVALWGRPGDTLQEMW